VVGIVASRMTERYGKPSFVAGFAGGDVARGSARSVTGVDLGAIVRAAHEAGHLVTGGGHAMAAGFCVINQQDETFAAFLLAELDPARPQILVASELTTDGLLSPAGATLGFLDDLEHAAPYGAGNPEPTFLIPDVQIGYAEKVGSNHVRLRFIGRDG